jgi:hypothetical protein
VLNIGICQTLGFSILKMLSQGLGKWCGSDSYPLLIGTDNTWFVSPAPYGNIMEYAAHELFFISGLYTAVYPGCKDGRKNLTNIFSTGILILFENCISCKIIEEKLSREK